MLQQDGESGFAGQAAMTQEERLKMSNTNPLEFLRDVRSEARKVTWPSRKETMITTGMVFVLVVVASIFFLLSDQIMRWGVGLVLGLGR